MRCAACGKYRKSADLVDVSRPTQATYLFGDADPVYVCRQACGNNRPGGTQ